MFPEISDGQSLRDGQWQCNRQRFKLFVEREQQQWDLQRYLNRMAAVSLTAGPSVGSTFSGWSVGSGSAASCSGPGPCSFSITQDSGVGAPFTLNTYTLTVSPSGTGSGSVTGNRIDCASNGSSSSGTCSVNLNYNTLVSLTAAPNAGSTFSGWSGGTGSAAGCSGIGTCAFTSLRPRGRGTFPPEYLHGHGEFPGGGSGRCSRMWAA